MSKFIEDMFNHACDISPEDALKICADHVPEDWSGLGVQDFGLSVVQ